MLRNKFIVRLVGLCIGMLAILGISAQLAHAENPAADSLVIDAQLADSGSLVVNSAFTFAESDAPDQLVARLATRKDTYDHGYYAYEISNVAASTAAGDLPVTVSDESGYEVVTIDTSSVKQGDVVTFSYTADGAVGRGAQDEPLLSWRFVQGLSVEVRNVSGKLTAPAMMTSIDCAAGAPGTTKACQMFAGGTAQYPVPTFENGALGAGETLTLEVGYQPGSIATNEHIKYDWTLDRAFSTTWVTALASLALLLLIGGLLALLHRRIGSDQTAAAPTPVAEFIPVAAGAVEFRVNDAVRPGEIGTVADERVDPIDVTGTIIDLAVRGYIRIHELPNAAHQPLDWSFERLEKDSSDLREFEKLLLDAVAPEAGQLRVSQLSQNVGPLVPQIQSALYDDVVKRGWFDRRPDSMRSTWGRIGWFALGVSLVVAIVLAAFTTWGLIGLVLIAGALGLVWVAERMPRRTAKGSGALAGLNVLSGVLQTYPTDQIAKGDEYEQISKVLPYAVVLGGRDRWLQALVAADDDPGVPDPTDLFWYHAPRDWHIAAFPAAMRSFVTTVQGELFSR